MGTLASAKQEVEEGPKCRVEQGQCREGLVEEESSLALEEEHAFRRAVEGWQLLGLEVQEELLLVEVVSALRLEAEVGLALGSVSARADLVWLATLLSVACRPCPLLLSRRRTLPREFEPGA